MTHTLVLCDHAKAPSLADESEHALPINQRAPDQNLRLEVWNISHKLLSTLDPVARDLLDIAAFVYYADVTVRRGTRKDVFGAGWVRQFTFVVPVRELEVWEDKTTNTQLADTLEYLMGDRFRFVFTERAAVPEQLFLQPVRDQLPLHADADCVALFSGGADSLAGAACLQASGRRPVLVSHQPRPPLVHTQCTLAAKLRERLAWDFPHLAIRINRKRSPAAENTQRGRAFLYLALGSLVAHELRLNELMVCENGITSFNLPRLGQTTGTLATRSTHPRFIEFFRRLVSRALGTDFSIQTPFIWKTRAEVLDLLSQSGCADLLPLSVSCFESRREKYQPFCGVCSQCVDRRFAVAYQGLDTDDELGLYEKDVFTSELGEGEEAAQATSTLMFALDLRKHSAHSFCEHYPEVFDAIGSLPGSAEQILGSVYDLHQRFAREVVEAMATQYRANLDAVFNCELPTTSLLMLHRHEAEGVHAEIQQRAQELTERLRECPLSENAPYEDVCEEILTFLFCEHTGANRALERPSAQSRTDQGRRRRDLTFANLATEGFWAEVRHDYQAVAIVVDAKNYPEEIDADVVSDFAVKYLDEVGPGRFGLVVARHLPPDTREVIPGDRPVPSAIEEQRRQWTRCRKVVILLDDDDLADMLAQKARGADPVKLIRDRFMTLRLRV